MNIVNKDITYITYDGILENIADSQVTSYILKLSEFNTLKLISFEKVELLKNKSHFNNLSSKLKSKNIYWKSFIYSKKPFLLGTFLNGLKIIFYLYFLSNNNKKTLYHCRSYLPALFCYILSKFKDINFIFDMRGFWADEKIERTNLSRNSIVYNILKNIEKKLIYNSEHIITLTNQSKNFIINNYKFKNNKNVTVIPTCVDTDLFKQNNISINKNFNIQFCYLGSVDGAYDIKYVLDYFYKLLKLRDNVFLKILTIDIIKVNKILQNYKFKTSNIEIKKVDRLSVINEIINSDIGIFYLKKNFSLQASYPTKIGELLSCGVPIICNSFNTDISKSFKENNIGININFDENDFNTFIKFS